MDTPAIIAAGEGLTTEFKSDTNDKELANAVACLANGEGGVLLIGATQLCQTSPPQARVTLKRLVDDERLVLEGERRGARYVLPRCEAHT